MATTATVPPATSVIHEKLSRGPGRIGMLVFGGVLVAGLIFIGTSIARDLGYIELGSLWPYVLLGTALKSGICNSPQRACPSPTPGAGRSWDPPWRPGARECTLPAWRLRE
jgi:hypothetical protein